MTDYHPDAYYHTRDELDAGTPGVVVTDSHEYGYCDEDEVTPAQSEECASFIGEECAGCSECDYSDSEECAPTLRATEVP